MDQKTDLLEAVISALHTRRGELLKVAMQAGMSYDTVLRIRSRENDPGYSKVKRLAMALDLIPKSLTSPESGARIATAPN